MAKQKKVKSQEVEIVKVQKQEPEQQKKEPEKTKPKKNPTKFAIFVKEKYNEVKDLPNKDRLKKLAQMYREQKDKQK